MNDRNNRLSAVGIIAEYNPFHNGHAYQIKKAKELSGADYCVVVMSGDFVQRGAPAIFDKYTRTRMALSSGADLVLEIPPIFAASSAEDFASCGVAMLDRLGVVTHLCFGSESGDIHLLKELAEILCQEPEPLSGLLKDYLKQGNSFPQARGMALTEYLTQLTPSEPAEFEQTGLQADCFKSPESLREFLSSPNNILGIEYCKALLKRKSSMIPVTVKRLGNEYHDLKLSDVHDTDCQDIYFSEDSVFSSASSIREVLKSDSFNDKNHLKDHVPSYVWELMDRCTPVFSDDLSSLVSYRLLELKQAGISLNRFADVSDDLASRIERQFLDFSSFENRIQNLKTKQYTYTRISRCLLHILLDMTFDDVTSRKCHDYISAFRVLGFRRDAAPLLSEIKKASTLPMITKTADASVILDPDSFMEFQRDLFCSHVYQSIAEQKSGIASKNEYTRSVIIV